MITILEYLGIYDEDYIQLHVVKIRANTREEADNKFIKYLEGIVYNGVVLEECMYVIPLFAVNIVI